MKVVGDRGQKELAYVVLADRVAFFGVASHQRQALEMELSEAVRDSLAVRSLSEPRRIVSEEDGAFVLAFFGDPEPAAEAAAQLLRSVRSNSDAPIRIGCHYGLIVRQRNAQGKWTIYGPGLSEGRRIMACSDGNTVVASLPFVENLKGIQSWENRFTNEIELEVIQGETLRICKMIEDPSRSAPDLAVAEEPLPRRNLMESTGGAVPLDSHFYIQRFTDHEFGCAIAAGESIVLVKGARQIGKTSLLARALGEARTSGSSIVLTDFQAYGAAELNDPKRLYQLLANEMATQLGLPIDIQERWDDLLGPNTNFERFIGNVVLANTGGQVVWAMDEIDRLFTSPYGADFFGLIRSWHNRRALDASGKWSRLTIAIAHATEAHLFIADLNQSPFNVGVRLELDDFSLHEAAELNRRYGTPLAAGELPEFYQLTGGQPYLCRHGFEQMVRRSMTLREFRQASADEDGPFGDHLRRILVGLRADTDLREQMYAFLCKNGKVSREAFYRLRSAGVLKGNTPDQAKLRCQIYEDFLAKHLALPVN